VSFHVGGDVITRQVKDRAGVDLLIAPRRHVLDAILVDAAIEAGADVRTGLTVTDVCRDGSGRATGIVANDADGRPVHIRSRFVVGADGLRSGVARSVGAALVDERHRNGSCRYTYVAGLGATGTEFHLGDGLFAGVFPTHDGEANVWVCGPAERLALGGPDVDRDQHHLDLLGEVSRSLRDRVLAGRRAAPVRGYHGMPNQLRQAAGPGWALVGDAGYFRDAVTGHGMSDAFRDAETLAWALDGALRGDEDDDAALARYATTRDRDVSEIFDLTCQLSSYPSRERFVALQKQLSTAIEAEAQMLAHRPAVPRGTPVFAA
jgi:flavin-dependent dehydrogenase